MHAPTRSQFDVQIRAWEISQLQGYRKRDKDIIEGLEAASRDESLPVRESAAVALKRLHRRFNTLRGR